MHNNSMLEKNCPHSATCAIYPQFTLNSNLMLWQDRYCKGAFETCARFKLSTAGEPVPLNLLPNGALLRKVRS